MKPIAFAISLAVLLGVPLGAQAQTQPQQADIVYLYRMQPASGTVRDARQTMAGLIQAMQQQHPQSHILLFQDLTDVHDYVALMSGEDAETTTDSGWSKDFLKRYTKTFPVGRSFVLGSTLLLGNTSLTPDASSLIQVEHVDSDPKKREANLPLFKQLNAVMQRQPGFKGLQVWTWDSRINHWTVIEVWENEAAMRAAERNPEVIRLWDQLYGNAAAPNSVSQYRLVDLSQP